MVEDTEDEVLSRQEEEKRLAELKEQERKDRRNETVRRYRQRKKEKKLPKQKPKNPDVRNKQNIFQGGKHYGTQFIKCGDYYVPTSNWQSRISVSENGGE